MNILVDILKQNIRKKKIDKKKFTKILRKTKKMI